jgi:hypothetical protein
MPFFLCNKYKKDPRSVSSGVRFLSAVKGNSFLEQVSLNEKCVIGGKSLCGLVYVAVFLALVGKVLVGGACCAVFIGICKALHDENSVCQLDIAVAVGIAQLQLTELAL